MAKKTTTKKSKPAYKVEKKRSGRYMVTESRTGSAINAEKKVEILLAEGLITQPKKKAEPAAVAEATETV